MGYRNLLKKYMAHVASVLGGDMVELAVLTNSLRKREISELKIIAAELSREPSQLQDERLNHALGELLIEGRIQIGQLAAIHDLVPGTDNPQLNKERLAKIINALAPEGVEA